MRGHSHLDNWFTAIADQLLNRTELCVGGRALRPIEVEFYYYGEGHRDPFAHRRPIQQRAGLWYFHTSGSSYRGGSFKGVDLTFGRRGAFGGILIRGLQNSAGSIIDGPSLCVDDILRCASTVSVADLDRKIAGHKVWDASSPLRLVEARSLEQRHIYRTARIGLNPQGGGPRSEKLRYLTRPYRFLTQPRGTRKGKLQLVLALHRQGTDAEEIRRLTGSSRKAIANYIARK